MRTHKYIYIAVHKCVRACMNAHVHEEQRGWDNKYTEWTHISVSDGDSNWVGKSSFTM